jgi:hypothetical protein
MWPDVMPEVLAAFGSNVGHAPNTSIWYTDSNPVDRPPAIFDCFIFNNEYEILEKRLRQLYDVVDRFIIVEGNKTHAGKPKDLNFDKNLSRFQPWLNKITYIGVTDFPEPEGTVTDKSWARERHQRDAIMRGLTQCRDNDVIIISDCDEIPSPTAIKSYNGSGEVLSFEMDLFYYNHETKGKDKWRDAKIAPYAKVKEWSPCGIRYLHTNSIPTVANISLTLGGINAINKRSKTPRTKSTTRQSSKNPDRIQKAIEEKRDLFDRDYVKFQ